MFCAIPSATWNVWNGAGDSIIFVDLFNDGNYAFDSSNFQISADLFRYNTNPNIFGGIALSDLDVNAAEITLVFDCGRYQNANLKLSANDSIHNAQTTTRKMTVFNAKTANVKLDIVN